jgi:small subunit ribosomal protein S21
MQVFVRDNNIDQALRILKKKMQREGIFREIKRRSAYEKPSERKTREKGEAIRRIRKLARKKAQRDGLLPPPKPKERTARPRDIFRSTQQPAATAAVEGAPTEPKA